MGRLDIPREHHHRHEIIDALKRRGMRPVFEDEDGEVEWEVHGPHEGMNYQVYVGTATYQEDPETYVHVSIALHGPGRGVYEIDTAEDWYKSDPERKIPVIT